MKKVLWIAGAAIALVSGVSVSTPVPLSAAEAGGSVCQFYRGDPLCKTVQEEVCGGASVGLEGRICRKTTEYWYWS